MKQIWFIADTHFGHANILTYSNRPFATIQEHDEALIANWNACIRATDDVYFLGDFAYRNRSSALEIRGQLQGRIHFIEGNHDDAARRIRDEFVWFRDVFMLKMRERDIWLAHYAHRVWNKCHLGSWHLYGHSHNSLTDDPNSRSIDVGVDAIAMRLAGRQQGEPIDGTRPQDYRPMHLDEIAAVMAKKTFVPIDHHGAARRGGSGVTPE